MLANSQQYLSKKNWEDETKSNEKALRTPGDIGGEATKFKPTPTPTSTHAAHDAYKLPSTALTASITPTANADAESVPYVDENGTLQSVLATRITADSTELTAGWYYVNETVEISHTVVINGGVTIILADGSDLSVDGSTVNYEAAIKVPGSSSLTILGQSEGTGKLSAASHSLYGPAIGFGKHEDSVGDVGAITICGGTVTATNDKLGGAGIGSGGWKFTSASSVTICGGVVSAKGGEMAAGIGGGGPDSGGLTVTISGGMVSAEGGGQLSCGIGGGYNATGGTVDISGGTVYAKGGKDAAGIAGSYAQRTGAVVITGGSVNAVPGPNGNNIRVDKIGSQTLKNRNGQDVYLNVLTVGDQAAVVNTPLTGSIFSGVNDDYGTKDVVTSDTGKVFVYLPASIVPEVTVLVINDSFYSATYTRLANHDNNQILYESSEDTFFIAAAKVLIERAEFTAAQEDARTVSAAKEKVESIMEELGVGLDGVNATVNSGAFVAAIVGTESDHAGADGSYVFTVTLSKGRESLATVPKTLTITTAAYHTVDLSLLVSIKGGVAAVNRPGAVRGSVVTLVVLPDTHYTLETISVNKTGEPAVSVGLGGEGNKRTFTMPDFGVTVYASFVTMECKDRHKNPTCGEGCLRSADSDTCVSECPPNMEGGTDNDGALCVWKNPCNRRSKQPGTVCGSDCVGFSTNASCVAAAACAGDTEAEAGLCIERKAVPPAKGGISAATVVLIVLVALLATTTAVLACLLVWSKLKTAKGGKEILMEEQEHGSQAQTP